LLENVRSLNATQSFNQWYASNLDYTAQGQMTWLQLGNGVNTTYTYDPLNFRLKTLQTGVNGALQNLAYGYDNVGNVMAITDTVNSNQVQSFTYDALDRLLTAGTNAVGNGQYTESYAYNVIGNITYTTRLGTYGYTEAAHKHAVTTLNGARQFWYDANGNMITRTAMLTTGQVMTYAQGWDAENRLVIVTNTATTPNAVSKFIYDGDGARVMQIQISGTQIMTTAYAGMLEVQITATQRITKAYYSAGGQLIAMRVYTIPTTSVPYYLYGDHSPRRTWRIAPATR
jgi:YD repeat-containing protein